MKIAILIPTYNRSAYLAQCLEYLNRADLSKTTTVLIIDDHSTDVGVEKLLINCGKTVLLNETNQGVVNTLYRGYELLFKDHDMVINLDSDALVRNDFVERLTERYISETLLTGFHSTTKGKDGKDRHIIIHETDQFYIKQSTGGINFCIDKYAYKKFVKPALEQCMKQQGNWDYIASQKAGNVYCLKQSVIQHIGIESSLGHHENPDTADDFKPLYLPVTLMGVDSDKERLESAKNVCTANIAFHSIVTLNPPIKSKDEYSRFMIKEVYKFIQTDHVLIFQYDGYINNWKAWNDDWLQYDYIGAPWYYNDGMAVGNGGFSLRTKRLMEILATDPHITILHPEDHHICRTYRRYLEEKYDIKFAPVEVAERFSFEGYMQPEKFLTNQFGRHGLNPRTQPGIRQSTQRYVVNQFLSLGDIIFLVPMIRELMHEGNTILWPIDDKYFSIAKHFPDIPFVKKSDYPDLPYESRIAIQTPHGKIIPYRFASENMGSTLHQCMESKYHLYGHDHNIWRSLSYMRDYTNETKLIKLVNAKGKFNLVNRYFGHMAQFEITPEITNKFKVIEMKEIEGFTLIDWLGVIELASEVHMSNSALNYLLELLELPCDVHIYKRGIWGEVGFEYTRHLFRNERFIYHE